MLNLSKKSELIPASPIRKLVPYSEEAKRKGVKVHHLNIGQPDIETPEVALDAIRNISSKVLEYTHSAGNESFRRGMAEYYQKLGLDVNYDDIIATNGGSEAILFTLMACVDTGGEVIVPEPFYANYNGFAAEAGVEIVPVVSTIDDNFALPAISEIEKKITDKTKAILLCNPNNPTGYLYTLDELEQLRDLALKADLFLIVDEVYREFCYDGNIHHSALKLEGAEDNVIVIDSLSKRYSMCGIRLGVVVSKNKPFIDAILRMGQARLCPPLLAQIAGEAALSTPQSYFDDVYNEYIERRNVTINALNEIEGVYAPMPMGAFYSIVKLPVDSADKFAQWILEEFSYNGETVMLAPASGFYATEGHGVDEVRIAYVLEKESLKSAVKCIEAALKEYNSRK
ncbi:MAG: pyridoxal phosphate-dependent aminotransferase [Rikenellaceae bacterium]